MHLEWNKNPDQSLKIISLEDFQKDYPVLYEKSILQKDDNRIRFCRIMDYQDEISGTFLVPLKEHPIRQQNAFAFCLDDNTLFFIGEVDKTRQLIESFEGRYDITYRYPLMFLVGLMLFMIQDDVFYLEGYNIRLEQIEENLFNGNAQGMERFIMSTRRDMQILSSYYQQLTIAAETLQKTIYQQKEKNSEFNSLILLYETKVNQLHTMVETIKSYTSQIWNLRQTQLSDHQNKITTILTVVTAIFLPLTLITGWFGMNFQDLPFIYSEGGYHLILVICLVIIGSELIFLISRRWFK